MPPSKLDRIEEKVNVLAEHMAAARTDIAWLKSAYAGRNGNGKSKAWLVTIDAVKVLGSAVIAYLTLLLAGGARR